MTIQVAVTVSGTETFLVFSKWDREPECYLSTTREYHCVLFLIHSLSERHKKP